MVLSKADILIGKQSYEEVEIKSKKGTICVRPLSISEIHQISEMKNKALGDYTANQKGSSKKRTAGALEAHAKMNMEKITIADNKADIKTVFWGLQNDGNHEKWSEEEISQMDPNVFDEILTHVKTISHMEDEDIVNDVENFPENE